MIINGYFNYRTQLAETAWERRNFLKSWWKMPAADRRWVPPYYPSLRALVRPQNHPHLARLTPQCLYLEALPRRRSQSSDSPAFSGALFEEPVAATTLLFDRRRQDGSAYLSLLQAANDTESMERLFTTITEQLWARGFRRVIGPTGLSPHLQSGMLLDHFHLAPPLHTPYNAPYLPEIAATVLQPLTIMHLYTVPVPCAATPAPDGPAQLTPLVPRRLAHGLLSLLTAACEPTCQWFPPPDYVEAAFILQQLEFAPLLGWLARVDRQPVGFVLLQPDLQRAMRRARGGRSPLWQMWLHWRARRGANAGRLLFGGVLPAWRGRGIGRQLLQQALRTAQRQGWRQVTVGPLPESAPAIRFLGHYGATARQRYSLYTSDPD
jgi:GNAT superfamily N-acetyltransferase